MADRANQRTESTVWADSRLADRANPRTDSTVWADGRVADRANKKTESKTKSKNFVNVWADSNVTEYFIT